MSSTRFTNGRDGFLIIDKPEGVRSTASVSAVKRALGRGVRVGHAGTLDSTAQGLLIVLVGKATRLCRYVMDLPKSYLGIVKFGVKTSTDDGTGDILSSMDDDPFIDRGSLESLVPSFLGIRMQRPPSISALKVDGRRAHLVSRSEKLMELPLRPVFITSLKVQDVFADKGEATIGVVCHKGTYIRSIARDMGDMSGYGAHLSSLRRISTGPFDVSDGVSFSEGMDCLDKEVLSQSLLPVDFISRAYRSYEITRHEDLGALKNGLPLPLSTLRPIKNDEAWCCSRAVVTGEGLLSVCRFRFEDDRCYLVPETNLLMESPS
ncbi:tRNA pseudouridine synthase B [Dethiosulfovibrio peptidovorans DSM 11002]|uniref:tRNA pseudouridine synthase B n=1 Tax=Dethiosulfovibrio peptidovorans DSM 11002 TaxID=469381 RepID=D2Z3W3_9BACT|nr:tRNA pseudouridine synthase B [Dethiosulfovibrio peptidovorans DSM 11002]